MTATDSMDPSFDVLFSQGTRLLHRGHAEQAATLLEHAYRLDPEHIDTAINLSGAYILIGKFKEAIPILESLSQRSSDNAMVWTNLGAAYLGNPILARSEEQQRAISAFEQALMIDPLAPSVAYNIGLIYRDRREVDKAVYWFGEALKANPNDEDAVNILERLTAAGTSS